MDPHEAIVNAVRIRVRPVLMTSLTTFVGQMPLALLPGAGSELYRGLASIMLGGMAVSTLGTLILVPVVLSMVLSKPRVRDDEAPMVAGMVGARRDR